MKKNNRLLNIILIIIALFPLVYLWSIWSKIPEIVPVHFNEKFEPDRTGPKSELIVSSAILSAVSIFMLLLFQNIKRFDPKRRNEPNSGVFNKIAAGILIFTTAINFMLITSSFKGASIFNNFFFPLLGLLFAFIGNYMNNIKPNYFAGIRLPWTLSDDDNWRKTHHMAGHLWFWGGLSIAVLALFLKAEVIFPILIATIVIMIIIPAIYSYRLFKNKQ